MCWASEVAKPTDPLGIKADVLSGALWAMPAVSTSLKSANTRVPPEELGAQRADGFVPPAKGLEI
jgi:hypothetical protein